MAKIINFRKKVREKKGLLPRTCSSCINTHCPLNNPDHLSLDERMVNKYGFCAEHISKDEDFQPYSAMEDLILTEDSML